MSATVQGMMGYGYLGDDTFDSAVAQLCLDAAKEYLANADVPEPETDSALYDLGCYMLAMHWYDQRGVVTLGAVQGEILHGVQSIIHQLRHFPETTAG